MKHLIAVVGLGALLTITPRDCYSQPFPRWRMARIGPTEQWNRAENVLVGKVANVIPVGREEIVDPPPPLPATIHEIYWCQAEFTSLAAVKGHLPAVPKKLLWAVIRPECGVDVAAEPEYANSSDPPMTRVWFLREEGEYLRPVVDGGVFSISLRWKWTDVRAVDVPRLFAMLLIDARARGLSAKQYSMALPDAAEIARSILGDAEVAALLKAGAGVVTSDLREVMCQYLEHQSIGSCQ